MRPRLLPFALSVVALFGLVHPASAQPATPEDATPEDATPGVEDARRGVVLRGLRAGRPGGPCEGAFEVGVTSSRRCTHGPDPAPPGVDVRRSRSLGELAADNAVAVGETAGGSILCLGDGTNGKRVQAIYAVASDQADRFAGVAPLIPHWATTVDATFAASAMETGGVRHVRWVTNPDCTLSVVKVVLSPGGDDSLSATEAELEARGFNRSDRKYLVWVDANVYCGIGGIYDDDRSAATNLNNGNASPLFARIDNGCWNLSMSVAAHELMHALGGVQWSAPHGTPDGGHCTDEFDRMCYQDGPSALLTYPCPVSHEALFDCNHDDYYSTAPPANSYLATHWNTASSAFLTASTASDAALPPPVPTPPPPAPTTTTPPAPATSTPPPPAPSPASPANGPASAGGYRLVAADGRSFGFGDTGPLGSTGALPVNPDQPVADAAATPDGAGAWAVTGGGAVFTLGSARFSGSLAGTRLNRPVVGVASTPSGGGYWLVASDGGIFAFGDARFYGSTGAIRLNQPIVGMASTPAGGGYWLVASDGGIFAFGDGAFFGSTGAIRLNQPIVGMAASATGRGYRFVASDGGVFSFGDARFLGSAADQGANVTAMVGAAR